MEIGVNTEARVRVIEDREGIGELGLSVMIDWFWLLERRGIGVDVDVYARLINDKVANEIYEGTVT